MKENIHPTVITVIKDVKAGSPKVSNPKINPPKPKPAK
jgi:hypothetical protein